MDFEPQTMRRVDTDIGNAKVLDQNRVTRCLTSERESRLFACGSKIQKLLIFPFLVRTNDEGVFRAFLLGGNADLPETVKERSWIFG